jgi:uncharacterized protein (TIGR03067 family)
MFPRILLTALIILVAQASAPAQDQTKVDLGSMQGSWNWDPAYKQSEAKPVILVEGVTIRGDKLTIHYNLDGKKFDSNSTFKINAKAESKEIDFTPTEGSNKGKTYLGLYEFKDGKLHICYRGPGASRPANFDDLQDRKTNDSTAFLLLKTKPVID